MIKTKIIQQDFRVIETLSCDNCQQSIQLVQQDSQEDSGRFMLYIGHETHPQLIKVCTKHLPYYQESRWFEEYE